MSEKRLGFTRMVRNACENRHDHVAMAPLSAGITRFVLVLRAAAWPGAAGVHEAVPGGLGAARGGRT